MEQQSADSVFIPVSILPGHENETDKKIRASELEKYLQSLYGELVPFDEIAKNRAMAAIEYLSNYSLDASSSTANPEFSQDNIADWLKKMTLISSSLTLLGNYVNDCITSFETVNNPTPVEFNDLTYMFTVRALILSALSKIITEAPPEIDNDALKPYVDSINLENSRTKDFYARMLPVIITTLEPPIE